MPRTADKALKDKLKDMGVKVVTYDAKAEDGRVKAMEKVTKSEDLRFSTDWRNNTGYTQKDNGRRLSNNALGAEEEGKFTKKDFCKRYGVAKEDFDMLEKIGVIKTNEWHHVGTKFKKENFYEWADWSDKDYENGNVESGSLAEVYQQNKKDIGRLTAEYNAKKWEYQGKETLSYVPTFEEWVGMQSKEDYLTDQDKADRAADHNKISNSSDLYNAYDRRVKHQEVDRYYNNIAYERMIKDDNVRKQYDDFKKQEDANNKAIDIKNAEIDRLNDQTDGKEKIIKQVADILNTEINIDAISRQAQNDERFAAREQAKEEWRENQLARIDEVSSRREDWLQKKLKAGSIKEVSRVPEKDKPEFFVETKREMNGRYGWFESRSGYNLPEYLSGYNLVNKRNKNTYDEFGKEIAEIDNETFADPRFSITPEQDQEYMDAVNSGDMEKAGAMVKAAFKAAYPNTKVVDENGEPLVVYHGSPRWFTEFKPQTSHANNINTPEGAYFFSKLRDNAQSYTSKKGSVELNPKKIGTRKVLNNNGEYEEIKDIKGGIYSVFLNITNPLIVDYKGNNWSATEMIYEATDWSEEEDVQFKTEEEREKWMNERKSEGHDVSSRRYEQPVDGLKETNIYIDSAISSGRYNGAIFTNIDDYGSYPHSNHEITDEFIAFQPNQIKSAEPVTYDEEGNVIPLSERFTESDDIRYSVVVDKKLRNKYPDLPILTKEEEEAYRITDAEINEMRERMKSWLTKDKLDRAKKMTRDERKNKFGNDVLPIAFVPSAIISLLGKNLKSNKVYSAEWYVIDHAVVNHPTLNINDYALMQEVLNLPEHIRYGYNTETRKPSFVFTAILPTSKGNRWNAVTIQIEADDNGNLIWYKNYYNQKKEPNKSSTDLLDSYKKSEEVGDLPSLQGDSSIIRTEAHGRSLSARSDISVGKGITNSPTDQTNSQENSNNLQDTNNESLNANIQDAELPLDEDVRYSVRKGAAPKNTNIGYKVFRVGKDGKLYPPMVANPNREDTPVGVWLNADESPIIGESKTGRPKVKATTSGTLAYRPGWHLGEIPYALQFNKGEKIENPMGILGKNGKPIKVGKYFPKDLVWAEVEYAADNNSK